MEIEKGAKFHIGEGVVKNREQMRKLKLREQRRPGTLVAESGGGGVKLSRFKSEPPTYQLWNHSEPQSPSLQKIKAIVLAN